MSEKALSEHVLFLAEGGNRKRAAVADAERVVAAGGRATLVIRQASKWRDEPVSDGVRVIDLHELEKQERWMPVEWLLLVRLPRFAFRVVGLGPVKGIADRASRAWRRRVANPLHARVFLPLIRRRERSRPESLLERGIGARTAVDLLVITDPASMPTAVDFLHGHDVPRVAYGLDHAAPAAAMGVR
jgi:hypothetical protein